MDNRPQKVIPHPTRKGFWTILIGDRIYGEFDRRELAVAIMLTR
ncbi:MAG TPA: hypothetical protein VGQ19_21060 [Burkholderiales bacterium]|jgi:hypothetical protein|nr:hypothetical protein [Burkholderiales bacterium]